jgi:hypothetical protein
MKYLALLLVALLLAAAPTVADAQYVRLSWGTCDPQVADTTFSGPGIYKLVVSAIGVDGTLIGHDSKITIGPGIQDAWRFDDGGCQGGERLAITSNGLSKTCPPLRGTNPLAITLYGYDAGTHTVELRLALVFDEFSASADTRYTLWQLTFDHTYSVAGADSEVATCDNAGPPYACSFAIATQVLSATGVAEDLQLASSDAIATWNGGSELTDGTGGSEPEGPVAIRQVVPGEVWQGEEARLLIIGNNLPSSALISLVSRGGNAEVSGFGLRLSADTMMTALRIPEHAVGAFAIALSTRLGVSASLDDALWVRARTPPPRMTLGMEWTPSGVPVAVAEQAQSGISIISDGAGGAILTWEDKRTSGTTGSDVYAQRLTALGGIAPGWPVNGIALCNAVGEQTRPRLCSDMSDGAVVVWVDGRNGAANDDIYAQHIAGDGTLVGGWPANGLALCSAAGRQGFPAIASDGTGGAIVVWEDLRSGNGDIYGIRIAGNGTIPAGWPGNGLAFCSTAQEQHAPCIASDGSGGAIAAWEDSRDFATTNLDIYTQRVAGDGAIVWNTNGVPVTQGTGKQSEPSAIADDASGAVIAFLNNTNGGDVYAQRITGNGTVAPGWNPAGNVLSATSNYQRTPGIVPDGAGGAIVAWDESSDQVYYDIYAQHVTAGGSIWPLWPARGLAIVTLFGSSQEFPTIVSDESGGALIAWMDTRNGNGDIFALRVRGTGEVPQGWDPDGIAICAEDANQVNPRIALDGSGGGVIGWADDRNGMATDIYAQRVTGNGVVGPTVGVDPVAATRTLGLVVSPSPATGIGGVWIHFAGGKPARVRIVNCLGRNVKSWRISGEDLVSLDASKNLRCMSTS